MDFNILPISGAIVDDATHVLGDEGLVADDHSLGRRFGSAVVDAMGNVLSF